MQWPSRFASTGRAVWSQSGEERELKTEPTQDTPALASFKRPGVAGNAWHLDWKASLIPVQTLEDWPQWQHVKLKKNAKCVSRRQTGRSEIRSCTFRRTTSSLDSIETGMLLLYSVRTETLNKCELLTERCRGLFHLPPEVVEHPHRHLISGWTTSAQIEALLVCSVRPRFPGPRGHQRLCPARWGSLLCLRKHSCFKVQISSAHLRLSHQGNPLLPLDWTTTRLPAPSCQILPVQGASAQANEEHEDSADSRLPESLRVLALPCLLPTKCNEVFHRSSSKFSGEQFAKPGLSEVRSRPVSP